MVGCLGLSTWAWAANRNHPLGCSIYTFRGAVCIFGSMKTRLKRFFTTSARSKRSNSAVLWGVFWLAFSIVGFFADGDGGDLVWAVGLVGSFVWFAASDVLLQIEESQARQEAVNDMTYGSLKDFVDFTKKHIRDMAEVVDKYEAEKSHA